MTTSESRIPGMLPATLVGGEKIVAHHPALCEGSPCAVHHPSDHVMKDWPQHWRRDRRIIERICPCGVGHPDPDHLAFLRTIMSAKQVEAESVHGCCGCCAGAYDRPEQPRSFQVPVWFNVKASSADEAWKIIQSYIMVLTQGGRPAGRFEYAVEEPIENEELIPTDFYPSKA